MGWSDLHLDPVAVRRDAVALDGDVDGLGGQVLPAAAVRDESSSPQPARPTAQTTRARTASARRIETDLLGVGEWWAGCTRTHDRDGRMHGRPETSVRIPCRAKRRRIGGASVMSERLRPRDLAFLEQETPTAPRHNATVEVFDPGDSAGLRLRAVRGADPRPDPVRAALPPAGPAVPGGTWPTRSGSTTTTSTSATTYAAPRCRDRATPSSCASWSSRIVSRPLDRARPLWEIYFVEGLADGRVALLYKTHQALVDGVETVDLGQVLLDKDPAVKILGGDEWHPHRHPSSAGLVAERPPRQPHRARDGARHRPARRRLRAPHRGPARLRRGSRGRPGSPAVAPTAATRSPASCRSSAAWSASRPGSPTTAPSATPTAAPSTTSSWPR